jgi:hypothetical protein
MKKKTASLRNFNLKGNLIILIFKLKKIKRILLLHFI